MHLDRLSFASNDQQYLLKMFDPGDTFCTIRNQEILFKDERIVDATN